MDEKNLLILGLISASPFANAEYLLRSHSKSDECGLPVLSEPLLPAVLQEEADLTFVSDPHKRAQGQIIYIQGIVRDRSMRPLENAAVEIWQPNKFGQYQYYPSKEFEEKYGRQKETLLYDMNFKGKGRAFTNSQGEYLLKTILPGEVTGPFKEIAPRQIHFQVKTVDPENANILQTVLYFPRGHELTRNDKYLHQVPLGVPHWASLHGPSFNSSFEKSSLIVYFSLIMS